jgi:hypothetical protein
VTTASAVRIVSFIRFPALQCCQVAASAVPRPRSS